MRRPAALLSTLRWRLTLFYCGLLAVLLGAAGVSVYLRFEDSLKSNVAGRLHDFALLLAPAATKYAAEFSDPVVAARVGKATLESFQALLPQTQDIGTFYVGVLDADGNVVADNQPLVQSSGKTIRPRFEVPTPADTPKGQGSRTYETTVDVSFLRKSEQGPVVTTSTSRGLVYMVPLWALATDDLKLHIKQGQLTVPTLYLALAAPLDQADSALQQIASILATGLLATLVVAALLGLPLARLGLRPLRRMADTATQIGSGELSRRVELPRNALASVEAHDEVGQLAHAFNAMLDRIEASFEAQQRSEARTRRFAADASHELRSPLTVLGGYLDVLIMGAKDDPAEAERILKAMQRENARLSRLVVDLLLLTRIDARGAEWLRLEPVLLSDLIARAVDNMRLPAGERDLKVLIARDLATVVVNGDADQLYRVLANLLDNAIRYTETDGSITVSLGASERGAGWVSLRVADDGCGIPPGNLPHIFDRFYRADESRTRRTGNAGLGLAICKSIVEAHGGNVGVESAPGRGAVFTVDLPLSQVLAPVRNSQQTLSRVSVTSKRELLD